MANLKDFATGTVLTAPTPATSGTTLTLQSGEGARMPAVPFYAVAHPDFQLPTLDNAEKILVTAKSTDTLTFTRAQGSTTAKSIAVGWRISNAVFADDLFQGSAVTNETPTGSINGSNTAFTVASAFTPGSLRVYLNGQRLKSGSGNDYTENAALTGFTMQYAPASGDVLLVDYNIGSSLIMQGTNVFINQETPTGSVNGSNTSFSTAKAYVSGTLEVYINGLLQAPTTHVTEVSPAAGTFSLDAAPQTGDIVRVTYQYAASAGGNAASVNGYPANATPTASQIPVLNSRAQTGEWWEEIGRASLSSAGDTMTISSLPAKKYLMVILSILPSGGTINAGMKFNNDSGTNYAYRTSDNGGADSTGASQGVAFIDGQTANTPHYSVTHIINIATQEKIMTTNAVARSTAGAANPPAKREIVNKWANTTDQITRIDISNSGTGDYAAGSEVVVLGHD